MIYVMLLNLGFNAKFVLEKENKEIWESYHKIALPAMELDSPNLDLELINLDMDLLMDLECMDLPLWDLILVDQDMDSEQDLSMEDIHIIKNMIN